MKSRFALILLLLISCRTGRPTGTPVAPLVATSTEDAIAQLQARRAAFHGMKSLMRVRATSQGKTQSFRAQLVIHDERRMDLVAYTPVGTTAMTMHIDGDAVKIRNHIEKSDWEGGARDLPAPWRFLSASFGPADIGMLILGFPLPGGDRPSYGIASETTATGLKTVQIGIARFDFTPPAFPAKSVLVTAGTDRVEIEHLEVVAE